MNFLNVVVVLLSLINLCFGCLTNDIKVTIVRKFGNMDTQYESSILYEGRGVTNKQIWALFGSETNAGKETNFTVCLTPKTEYTLALLGMEGSTWSSDSYITLISDNDIYINQANGVDLKRYIVFNSSPLNECDTNEISAYIIRHYPAGYFANPDFYDSIETFSLSESSSVDTIKEESSTVEDAYYTYYYDICLKKNTDYTISMTGSSSNWYYLSFSISYIAISQRDHYIVNPISLQIHDKDKTVFAASYTFTVQDSCLPNQQLLTLVRSYPENYSYKTQIFIIKGTTLSDNYVFGVNGLYNDDLQTRTYTFCLDKDSDYILSLYSEHEDSFSSITLKTSETTLINEQKYSQAYSVTRFTTLSSSPIICDENHIKVTIRREYGKAKSEEESIQLSTSIESDFETVTIQGNSNDNLFTYNTEICLLKDYDYILTLSDSSSDGWSQLQSWSTGPIPLSNVKIFSDTIAYVPTMSLAEGNSKTYTFTTKTSCAENYVMLTINRQFAESVSTSEEAYLYESSLLDSTPLWFSLTSTDDDSKSYSYNICVKEQTQYTLVLKATSSWKGTSYVSISSGSHILVDKATSSTKTRFIQFYSSSLVSCLSEQIEATIRRTYGSTGSEEETYTIINNSDTIVTVTGSNTLYNYIVLTSICLNKEQDYTLELTDSKGDSWSTDGYQSSIDIYSSETIYVSSLFAIDDSLTYAFSTRSSCKSGQSILTISRQFTGANSDSEISTLYLKGDTENTRIWSLSLNADNKNQLIVSTLCIDTNNEYLLTLTTDYRWNTGSTITVSLEDRIILDKISCMRTEQTIALNFEEITCTDQQIKTTLIRQFASTLDDEYYELKDMSDTVITSYQSLGTEANFVNYTYICLNKDTQYKLTSTGTLPGWTFDDNVSTVTIKSSDNVFLDNYSLVNKDTDTILFTTSTSCSESQIQATFEIIVSEMIYAPFISTLYEEIESEFSTIFFSIVDASNGGSTIQRSLCLNANSNYKLILEDNYNFDTPSVSIKSDTTNYIDSVTTKSTNTFLFSTKPSITCSDNELITRIIRKYGASSAEEEKATITIQGENTYIKEIQGTEESNGSTSTEYICLTKDTDFILEMSDSGDDGWDTSDYFSFIDIFIGETHVLGKLSLSQDITSPFAFSSRTSCNENEVPGIIKRYYTTGSSEEYAYLSYESTDGPINVWGSYGTDSDSYLEYTYNICLLKNTEYKLTLKDAYDNWSSGSTVSVSYGTTFLAFYNLEDTDSAEYTFTTPSDILYCEADGEWVRTAYSETATLECATGYTGSQSRYCAGPYFEDIIDNCKPIAPTSLTYPSSSYAFNVNDNIHLEPTIDAVEISYSISPELPSFIHLDSLTGIISGIAESDMSTTTYTIKGENESGFVTFSLSILIKCAPDSTKTEISIENGSVIYVCNSEGIWEQYTNTICSGITYNKEDVCELCENGVLTFDPVSNIGCEPCDTTTSYIYQNTCKNNAYCEENEFDGYLWKQTKVGYSYSLLSANDNQKGYLTRECSAEGQWSDYYLNNYITNLGSGDEYSDFYYVYSLTNLPQYDATYDKVLSILRGSIQYYKYLIYDIRVSFIGNYGSEDSNSMTNDLSVIVRTNGINENNVFNLISDQDSYFSTLQNIDSVNLNSYVSPSIKSQENKPSTVICTDNQDLDIPLYSYTPYLCTDSSIKGYDLNRCYQSMDKPVLQYIRYVSCEPFEKSNEPKQYLSLSLLFKGLSIQSISSHKIEGIYRTFLNNTNTIYTGLKMNTYSQENGNDNNVQIYVALRTYPEIDSTLQSNLHDIILSDTFKNSISKYTGFSFTSLEISNESINTIESTSRRLRG